MSTPSNTGESSSHPCEVVSLHALVQPSKAARQDNYNHKHGKTWPPEGQTLAPECVRDAVSVSKLADSSEHMNQQFD